MGDNPKLESSRQMNTGDLLESSRSTVPEPTENSSLPKGGLCDVDVTKAAGMKRSRSHSSQEPALSRFKSNGSSSEHLVYVRRKFETEHGKLNSGSNVPNDGSTKPKTLNLCEKQQSNDIQEKKKMPSLPSFSAYLPTSGATMASSVVPSATFPSEKHLTGFSVVEPNNPGVNIQGSPPVNCQEASKLHWKDRFLQVQAFLRKCDQSNQEEYIQMLRSLSPVERSNHAVALEKRAIHLLLEEGKELHLMRVLNVFGRASPVKHNSATVEHSTPNAAEVSKR